MRTDCGWINKRVVLVLAGLFSLVFLTACPPGVRISQLTNNPGKYQGREVAVSGNVVNTYGALGIGAYELDDGTGRIWVLSEGMGVPGKGAHLTVTGTVLQGASLGGRSFGLGLRQTRRSRGY